MFFTADRRLRATAGVYASAGHTASRIHSPSACSEARLYVPTNACAGRARDAEAAHVACGVLDFVGPGTPRRQRYVQRIPAARREFGCDVKQVRGGRGDRDLVFHGLRRQRDGDKEADQPAHRVTPRGRDVLCTPLKTKRPRRLVRAAWWARRARQELTFSLASATIARNSLLGLKTGTGRAATSTGSPVRGLRAMRVLRCRILNVPNPRISMLCCSASAAFTASRNESTTRAQSFFEMRGPAVRAICAVTFSTRSAFVIRPP